MKKEGNRDREIAPTRSYTCGIPYMREIGDLAIANQFDECEFLHLYYLGAIFLIEKRNALVSEVQRA